MPSTADIIRMIREVSGGGSPAAEAVPAAEEPQAAAPAEAPTPAPAAGGSPLDAIRAAGGGAKTKSAAGGSPLDAIRAAGGGSASSKPAAGGSPLDMIRAASGGGGAAVAPEKKAAPKKSAAASVSAGDLPPVKEMLEQMRGAKQAAADGGSAPAPAPKPVKPAKPELRIPKRPSKAAAASKDTRRGFIVGLLVSPFAWAWAFLTLMGGVWTLALARFMFPNVLVEPPSSFKIGPPSDYPLGTVSTKWTAKRGIWVVHTDEYEGKPLIYALASVCTHLGCTPSWLEGEQKFKCPCHGSGFYITGVNFEGPAPRPLERVGLRLAADGSLEVDKSVKFQEEKGQWEDGNSFVDASLV